MSYYNLQMIKEAKAPRYVRNIQNAIGMHGKAPNRSKLEEIARSMSPSGEIEANLPIEELQDRAVRKLDKIQLRYNAYRDAYLTHSDVIEARGKQDYAYRDTDRARAEHKRILESDISDEKKDRLIRNIVLRSAKYPNVQRKYHKSRAPLYDMSAYNEDDGVNLTFLSKRVNRDHRYGAQLKDKSHELYKKYYDQHMSLKPFSDEFNKELDDRYYRAYDMGLRELDIPDYQEMTQTIRSKPHPMRQFFDQMDRDYPKPKPTPQIQAPDPKPAEMEEETIMGQTLEDIIEELTAPPPKQQGSGTYRIPMPKTEPLPKRKEPKVSDKYDPTSARKTLAAIGLGVPAVAGGAYLYKRRNNKQNKKSRKNKKDQMKAAGLYNYLTK